MVYTETFEDNYKIEIGRNAQENDNLVKGASQSSLWFHLDGQPSPHGILTNTVEPGYYTNSAIFRCAELVKAYSKAKLLRRVKVDCLEVQYVRRTTTLGLVNLMKSPKIIIV